MVEAVVDGVGVAGRVAKAVGVPFTTARDWLRRFTARAPMLATGFAGLAVEVGAEAGIASLAVDAARRAVEALRLVGEMAWASSLSLWALASLVTGGKLLAATTDPPWTVLGNRRFMPPVP
ncbi:MAG: hypothetical protein ACRDY5_09060 [Acidimicrobiales bacterium]